MNDFSEQIAERYRRDENLEDEELTIFGTLYLSAFLFAMISNHLILFIVNAY